MDFICTLDPGLTDMSGKSAKCFSACVQRTPCIKTDCINSFNRLNFLKIQKPGPTCVNLWIRCFGLEPSNLNSDPSPGDSNPQQRCRNTCNGGGGNVEGSCHE